MKIAALANACLPGIVVLVLVAVMVVARAAETPRLAPAEPIHPHVDAQRHSVEPPHGRVCFNSAETREKIISRRLGEPFRLLRGATGHLQGEALRARLCRWNDEYVYEISLLRRDGRVIHVYLNATSGQTVGALNDR